MSELYYLFICNFKTPGKSAEILIIKAMKKVITSVNNFLSTNVHKYGGTVPIFTKVRRRRLSRKSTPTYRHT